MINQPNASGDFGTLWLILLFSIIGLAIYLELSFPKNLKDLWP